MYNGKKILALVPARAGSKGLPGKNVRLLLNKPLIAWSIEAGLRSKYVDRVIASTDGEDIASVAGEYGADVPFLRPAELALDSSPSIDFILHTLDWLQLHKDIYEYLVLLEPTSPLRDSEDVDLAIEALLNQGDRADSILGVKHAHGLRI